MNSMEIAQSFMCERNPMHWNGVGDVPCSVDTRTMLFKTDQADTRLEITIDLWTDDGEKFRWCCCCELVEKRTCETISIAYTDHINSVIDLADAIDLVLEE